MPSFNFFKAIKNHPNVTAATTTLLGLVFTGVGFDFDDGTVSEHEQPLFFTGITLTGLGLLYFCCAQIMNKGPADEGIPIYSRHTSGFAPIERTSRTNSAHNAVNDDEDTPSYVQPYSSMNHST